MTRIVFLSDNNKNLMSQRWSIQRAHEWYEQMPWLVGCNFIPSTAINQLEMWQVETFDPETIDKELGWAASLGMNTVRVFLHDLLWVQDAVGFKQRIHQFLTIADKYGIRTMLVFFDDCWWPNAKLGTQPEPIQGMHNSGWLQSPGHQVAKDVSQLPRLKAYVQDIVNTFAADKRVLLWDIYNEMGNTFLTIGTLPGYLRWPKMAARAFRHLFLPLPTLPLLLKTADWIREVNPSQPITAGIWFAGPKLKRQLIEVSDVISFHNYFKAHSLERQIKRLGQYGRPMLCTEYMSRTSGSIFQTHLPIMKKYKVAAYNWGLVDGKTQTKYTWEDKPGGPEPTLWFHDVFNKDGTPYSQEEVEFIRKITLDQPFKK